MTSKTYDDDSISYSSMGETFSSRRRRKPCTLRQHSIDNIAQKLKFDPSLEEAVSKEDKPIKRKFNNSFHSFRFVVVMFGGFSLGTMFLLRYNITVSILSMVNQTALYMEEHPGKTIDDFLAEGYSLGGEFDWDNEIQHMIMSLYMIAYTLPQLPATKLGLIIGSRWATPISLTLCSIATILTPIFAYWGWRWVIFLRLINGIGASAVLPMMLNLIENWMPYNEISLGLTLAQILQSVLTSANPIVSGYLSSYHWSYSFYVPGIAALIFCLIWIVIITDRPDQSWIISEKELQVIYCCKDDRVPEKEDYKQPVDEKKEKQLDATEPKPNWTQVFRVPSFYAFLFIWIFNCSSYSCFAFILPAYLRQFLKISVANNGLYCSLIQSGGIIATIWPHPFLQIFENKFKMSPTASRRATHLIICLMAASSWAFVGFSHDSQLIVLFINRCFHGSNDIVITSSLMANYSKAGLSSLVFSMVNTIGNLSIVFTSPLIGYILDAESQSVSSWSLILYGLACSQLIMLVTYATVIRSEPINFNKTNNSTKRLAIESIKQDHGLEIICDKGAVKDKYTKSQTEKE